jgi:hypothetical protein
MRTEVL